LFASVKRKKRAILWIFLVLLILLTAECITFFSKQPPMDKLLRNFVVMSILVYAVWEHIKAVPIYKTINVALVFWSISFILSTVFYLFTKSVVILIFNVWTLLFLILTIFKKREILKWKKRIFKRGFSFLSVLS